MAEFSEVIKQFKRMCKSISSAKCTRGECPMGYEFGCENIGQCRKIIIEEYDKFEDLVMAWAADNPEPVYPTWGEWLETMWDVNKYNSFGDCVYHTPIPADIAWKLSIEPKE